MNAVERARAAVVGAPLHIDRRRAGADGKATTTTTGGAAQGIHCLALGSSHARRVAAAAPRPPLVVLGTAILIQVCPIFAGNGIGGAARAEVEAMYAAYLFQHRLPDLSRTFPPNVILLAPESTALTTDDDPQALHLNHQSLSTAVSGSLQWLIGCLQTVGATGSVVVVLSTIPKAQLKGCQSAFRALSDAQRMWRSQVHVIARKKCNDEAKMQKRHLQRGSR